MPLPPPLVIEPPLVNSSNPWATDLDDLSALYDCPFTGAVTTRTSLSHDGFAENPQVHKYTFFNPVSHQVGEGNGQDQSVAAAASVNSLGYSPIPIMGYLRMIADIEKSQTEEGRVRNPKKGFIVSVTGAPVHVAALYGLIACTQSRTTLPLAMEINLSCPNIPNAPPPAYDADSLLEYLGFLQVLIDSPSEEPRIPFGIKTPPYTHPAEFQALMTALRQSAQETADGVCPVSFITATNTLGSCLVLDGDGKPALPGSGLGGMGGASLHPLALGNVATIRRMLDDEKDSLGHIQVLGVGGVMDADGYRRMRSAGAFAVGVGTGLGIKGVDIFREISEGLAIKGEEDLAVKTESTDE